MVMVVVLFLRWRSATTRRLFLNFSLNFFPRDFWLSRPGGRALRELGADRRKRTDGETASSTNKRGTLRKRKQLACGWPQMSLTP
jgi:hypothetical protein